MSGAQTETSSPNPYAAPEAEIGGVPGENPRARVVAAAEGQRLAILLFLSALGISIAGQFAGLLLTFVSLLIQIGYVFVIVRTFYRIQGVGSAILWGIVALLPLLSIISVVVLSVTASRMLKRAGFRVGLLGANVEHVRAWSIEG